jgi:hypothetical protein
LQRSSQPWRLPAIGVAAGALLLAVAVDASATATGTVREVSVAQPIKDSYIVVLKSTSGSVPLISHRLTARYGGTVRHTYQRALQGFSVRMTAGQAARLAANPAVSYVEQDSVMTASATQPNPPSWGLDRIDQRNRPLSNSYPYNTTASNVHAYIIDTGIRTTHVDSVAGRRSVPTRLVMVRTATTPTVMALTSPARYERSRYGRGGW